jgi:hypothetical protein
MAFIKNPPGSSAVQKMVMDRLSKFSLSRKSKDWSKKELMQMVELQEAQLIQMETQNQHLNKLQIVLSDSLRVTIGRFEAIPIGLMRIDRTSEIQMINHRCAQIFLVDRLKLIGSNISQYLSVAGLAIFEGLMAQNKISNEVGSVLAGQWGLAKKYPVQILRGSSLGTLVGALPGAGADIAAWMSYAMSKKFSKEPEKFGTGHVEGIVESGSANNSALAGAWIPALVFGIPGDSITAIVIGVLYMKNMNPGPTLFTTNPQNIYAVFLLFIVANIIMIPLGILCIKVSKRILRVPREILMPLILLFCVVGTFAINNALFEVGVMLVAGILAYVLESNRFPIAPAILGVVLGGMLEENFITSMIKSDGNVFGSDLFSGVDLAGADGLVAQEAPSGLKQAKASSPMILKT